MPSTVQPRLSGRTIGLGCALLPPVTNIPKTLTLNDKRRSWPRNRHEAFVPLMGGIWQQSWRSFAGMWPELRMNTLLRT
jgi:hypothetical protein